MYRPPDTPDGLYVPHVMSPDTPTPGSASNMNETAGPHTPYVQCFFSSRFRAALSPFRPPCTAAVHTRTPRPWSEGGATMSHIDCATARTDHLSP